MATYKLILKNPYTKKTLFKVKFNGGVVDINLQPQEKIDLSTIHPSFTIQANSTTDISAQQKIAEIFMSNKSNPSIVMKGNLTKSSKFFTIRKRPYSDFIELST